MKHLKLSKIANITFGLYQKTRSKGDIPYLQASQFDENGRLNTVLDTFIESDQKNQKHLLKRGDIVLAGKGFRNFAWVYDEELGPLIPSSMFFVIRVFHPDVDPNYLNITLNLPTTQTYFQTLAAGTKIPSIRKSELAELKIPIPPIEIQHKIVELHQLHQVELTLTEQILNQKRNLIYGVIQKLINA